MKNSTKNILYIVMAVLALIVVSWVVFAPGKTVTKTSTQFWNELNSGKVAQISVNSADLASVRVVGSEIKEANFPAKADYTVVITSRVEFENKIKYYNEVTVIERITGLSIDEVIIDELTKEQQEEISKKTVGLEFTSVNTGSLWETLLPILFSTLVLVGLAFFVFRSMSGSNKQAMGFGKTKARVSENVKVKFNDVAGAEEEKEELKEIVEFLKSPQKFSQVGARIPKGVLLVGPPGTGKTLFAKAVAGEANVPFFQISGSDFVEMFVGVGASRVRDLFDQAKRNMPCIVFIDEIDAVGRQRGAGLGGGNDEREQTLNQLLVQMDGFEKNEGIIIIAATNRADILDPALMRPGRFDRQIYVNVPDVRGREEILKVHSRNKPISKDIDFKTIARMTSGFTGADIENLLNEAAILAARANRQIINMDDVAEGIKKVIMGPQKKSRVVTEYDKRITAYHEAGHAIVGRSLEFCDPVHEVSIIPRGGAAGYTLFRPANDDHHETYNKLNDDIAMSLGGRAAEEIVIKDITSGASQDIRQSTQIARAMVTEWGMSSEVGTIYYGGGQEVFLGRDYQSTVNYSEVTSAKIDAEITKLVEGNHQRALKILNEKRDVMDNMARLLIERETIFSEEVDMLMEGKSLAEINEFIDSRNLKKANESK